MEQKIGQILSDFGL